MTCPSCISHHGQLTTIIPDFSWFRGVGNQVAIGPHNVAGSVEGHDDLPVAKKTGTGAVSPLFLSRPAPQTSQPSQNKGKPVVKVRILAPEPFLGEAGVQGNTLTSGIEACPTRSCLGSRADEDPDKKHDYDPEKLT